VATAGNASTTLSWTAPSTTGGGPLTGYTVIVAPGVPSAIFTISGTTATVTGLSNGTNYVFQVYATNAVGNGVSSEASNPVTPMTVPGVPTGIVASAGDASATLSWSAPVSNGGSAIIGYALTISPATPGAVINVTGTSALVTGLANGTNYSFQVYATNAEGDGLSSAPSNLVTPMTVPGPPTALVATAGVRSATLGWIAPASTGGGAVIGYAVQVSPAVVGASVSVTGTGGAVTGLANATIYTFTVTATNSAGTSPASAPSDAVTTPDVPGAPTAVVATASNASATLSWSAPSSDGGSPLTGYTVVVAPGVPLALFNVTGTSATVTGLRNGTNYTFQVFATNEVGSGALSSASNSIAPVPPPSGLAYSYNPAVLTVGTPLAGIMPTISGGEVKSYTVSPSLPLGLILGVGNGVIYGTPYAATAATIYTVTAANAAGTTSATVTITVIDPARAWTHVYPGATRQSLSAVACFGPDLKCTAFGSGGTTLGSADGSTWKSLYAATSGDFRAVSIAGSTTGYAVSAGAGRLLKTTDSGEYWLPSGSAYSVDAVGIHFINDSTGWIVGNAGAISKTTDGGATWTLHDSANTLNWASVTTTHDLATVLVTGSGPGVGSLIRRSTDGGQTWTLSQVSAGGVESIACPENDKCFAACGQGILLSTDGGVTWTSVFTSAGPLRSFSFSDALHGWAIGERTILVTLDGGATWMEQSVGFNLAEHSNSFLSPLRLQAVWATSAERAVIVGSNGLILTTIDGGSSWVAASRDTYVRVQAIRTLDANTAVVLGRILGESFVIERTSNGGITWTRVASVPESASMASLILAPGPTLYAFGSGNALRSADGGVTWTALTWGNLGPGSDGAQCPMSNVCWAAGGNNLWRTLNSGDTWSTVSRPEYLFFAFLDDQTGFAGLLGTKRTTDGAASWSAIASIAPEPAWARSATEYWGWGAGSKLQSVRSDDGGVSWSVMDAWSTPLGCTRRGSSRLPEMFLFDCGSTRWGMGRIELDGSISLTQFSLPTTPVVNYADGMVWGVDIGRATDSTWFAAVNGDVYRTSSAAK
jgi:photosystem II stability/assembly factor-like uncharacterized protein/chitodextrinase